MNSDGWWDTAVVFDDGTSVTLRELQVASGLDGDDFEMAWYGVDELLTAQPLLCHGLTPDALVARFRQDHDDDARYYAWVDRVVRPAFHRLMTGLKRHAEEQGLGDRWSDGREWFDGLIVPDSWLPEDAPESDSAPARR